MAKMTSRFNQLLDRIIRSLRTRHSRIVLGLGICLLIIIILLPHGISYGVRNWLQQHGAEEATIEDVDFNPFTGRLEFNDLRISVAQKYTLVLAEAFIDVDWLPLFSKQFQVNEVFIENTDITLEQRADGRLLIGGVSQQSPPTGVTPADNNKLWGFGLDNLTIVNSKLHFSRPQLDLTLHIDTANLTGLQSREQAPAHLTLTGKINDSPLQIDSQLSPFATQAGFDADIKLQSLSLADFARLAQPHLDSLSGTLSMNGHMKGTYQPARGMQIANDGELALHDLDITDSNLHIKSDQFAWTGSVRTELGKGDTVPPLTLAGGMSGGKISVRDRQTQTDTANLLNIDAIKLAEVQFDNNDLHITSVDIQQLQASLQRNPEGKLALFERLATPAREETAVESDRPLTVRIDDIEIGRNSSLTFEDRSTRPTFKSVVHLDSVKLSGLDSRQPQQAANFAIDGKVGKFSSLVSKGKIQPFLPQFGLKMATGLKALELPPLTSYTSGMLGYKLVSGQLQADIKVDIHNNKLDGESRLVLNNMNVQALTAEEKKAINTQADMSLELSLAMLRDKQNNIKLSLPFKGDLNDPKFDLSDAINQAIRKAVTTTSMSFLKLSLQPFGTILMVADIASRVAGAVQLQPVIFAAGSTTLDATALAYQERLASLLNKRPQLRIKICGVATSSDRAELATKALEARKARQATSTPEITDEQLLEFAERRADTIKEVLINRHNIGADRLFSCQPRIDPDKDAGPRVELGI